MQPISSLPAACGAAAQFGDAVALIDRVSMAVTWTSPAWKALPRELAQATNTEALEPALKGLSRAIDHRDGPLRLTLGDARQWQAEIASLEGAYWLLRLTDQQEQRRAQQRQLDDREQLLFTSRTLSVGEMATTLAHELNQPIGAAANLLRGLRSRVSRRKDALDKEEAGALERAIEQVMFASRVITRIREFTHSHQPRLERVDLGTLVRESASLLDWDFRRCGARLTIHMADKTAYVRGDRVMLQQVLVNLIRNALDALRADPPADPHLQLRLNCAAGEVTLQVRDNGCGLDAETEARLFVPFASSKPTGMGIGLSICRSFLELHQGRLWFSRNPDGGATFHIGLPLWSVPAELPEPVAEEALS